MELKPKHFDAFISYRHLDRDKKVADTLQKLLENFRSPCDGAHIRKGDRIRRLFTDRSELPLSADLGSSITQALEQSHFLLVIASPEYMQSRWCMEELKTFLKRSQGATDRILFVQVGGSASCVTDILRAAGVAVDAASFREPLYISACAPTLQEIVKIIKQEYLRVAAVLIGCSFDGLYQRHKRAKIRRLLISAAIFLLIGASVGTAFAIQALQRQREADYRAMDAAIAEVYDLLRAEDRMDALTAMQTLYRRYGNTKAYASYLARQLEISAIQASYVPALEAFAKEPLPFSTANLSVSSDGNYVIAYDGAALRENGEIRAVLYDAYLNKLSEHTLPVEEWRDDLHYSNISDTLYIDYLQEQKIFAVEQRLDETKTAQDFLGRRLEFSADGQLLSNRERTADTVGRASAELRTMYAQYASVLENPFCMGADAFYTITTKGASSYEIFGPKGEKFKLVSVSAAGDIKTVAQIERFSNVHAIDNIYITPDDRFVLVEETQGIYHDVITAWDTSGRWKPITIDMDSNHRILNMEYRFDEKTQNAYFLFNLGVAGEDNAGIIVQCCIASGELRNCEMYNCNTALDCLFSAQGYVYIMDRTDIIAITTENICLPMQLYGIEQDVPLHADTAQNALAADPEAGSMPSVPAGDLIITADVGRTNHLSPALYTGNDNGVGIHDNAGNELVHFYSDGILSAYYNREDGVFGLMDYADPENSQLFPLYDFHSLMKLSE